MSGPGPIGGVAAAAASAATAGDARLEKLRRSTSDLEGVFVEQLFKAMRDTVPTDGLLDGGSGEEMFTGLLDQKFSAEAPGQWKHGLSESLLRQLAGRLGSPPDGTAAPSGVSPPGATTASSPAGVPPILSPNALTDASRPEHS